MSEPEMTKPPGCTVGELLASLAALPNRPADPLLPCPFCGGEAVEKGLGGPWIVECVGCGAATDTAGNGMEAAVLWNRRTPMPQGTP